MKKNSGVISCPVEDLLFRLTRGYGDAGTRGHGEILITRDMSLRVQRSGTTQSQGFCHYFTSLSLRDATRSLLPRSGTGSALGGT
ncbi:MAG: hypothetical protein RMY29_009960 [Nostoc sp. CreGUA01]|nr:hypothetical protein [Nostoc sp. CreGUA01]